MVWPPATHPDVEAAVGTLRSAHPHHALPYQPGRWYTAPANSAISTLGVASGDIYWGPLLLPTGTLNGLGVYVSGSANSTAATATLGLYDTNPTTGKPGNLLLNAGAVVWTPASANTWTVNYPTTRGTYWVALLSSGATVPASGGAGGGLLVLGLGVASPTAGVQNGYWQSGLSSLPATAASATLNAGLHPWFRMGSLA